MKKLRTRYAPSPTGYLHIGGARTALFNYLLAKHYNGDFIIRIEDTDVKRNIADGEASQIENLKWLNIEANESPLKPNEKYGPYRQSQKLEKYLKIAHELIEKGYAYKAYDNSEELEEQKKHSEKLGVASFRYQRDFLKISEEEKQKRDASGAYSIRVICPKNTTYQWDDLVRGNIAVNSNDIGDWIIIKSDGYPTYNFAVVIDDIDMEISHILRGEEHITNTPKQMMIYDYLNAPKPLFGHLTIITNMEGKKLSKRDLSLKQFIHEYKEEGYNSQAIFNFLTLLGWTDEKARELMDHDEIIKSFLYTRLSKSPSKFDITKMQWFSKQYWKNTPNEELIKILNLNDYDNDWINLFLDLYKENIYSLNQLKNYLKIYKQANLNQEKDLDLNDAEKNVVKSFSSYIDYSNFSVNQIQEAINKTQEKLSIKGKNLFLPIRKATTFQEHGPELAKAIYLFGSEIIEKRMKKWK
ncbi:glutamate--tRNA ligase [Mycoplasmopsis pulmonis]|uniref:glutamate--tRNA ligase n=1 Tax=Mycoplasmopsis pulmonis TaxID=2107 RepID=UPI002ACD94D3|nr:glutamate--tRNA ligase [Mycoplasmopsis pulmonis]MDZ7293465.1 glutamate--tRNA ligase [Mycoplasmopsis pulmonis]